MDKYVYAWKWKELTADKDLCVSCLVDQIMADVEALDQNPLDFSSLVEEAIRGADCSIFGAKEDCYTDLMPFTEGSVVLGFAVEEHTLEDDRSGWCEQQWYTRRLCIVKVPALEAITREMAAKVANYRAFRELSNAHFSSLSEARKTCATFGVKIPHLGIENTGRVLTADCNKGKRLFNGIHFFCNCDIDGKEYRSFDELVAESPVEIEGGTIVPGGVIGPDGALVPSLDDRRIKPRYWIWFHADAIDLALGNQVLTSLECPLATA